MVRSALSLNFPCLGISARLPKVDKRKLLRNAHICFGVKKVVVVGSINEDSVLTVERLPQPGETISAASWEMYPGGKVSLKRLLCRC